MIVRAVIFDLDHTLYNFMDCHEKADSAVAEYLMAHFGIDHDIYRIKLSDAMKHTNQKIGVPNASTHSRTLRYQTLLEDFGAYAIEHAYTMRQLYWNTFYEYMVMEPVVLQVLKGLKDRGITIIIATDMTADVQLEKIRILGLTGYVDYLVTSEEAGEEKPGERILKLCLKKAGCTADECVFVGDHPIRDVTGPMNFGIKAVWCRHFDPERFLAFFGTKIDDAVYDKITYIIDSYKDCFDEQGHLNSLGGLKIL